MAEAKMLFGHMMKSPEVLHFEEVWAKIPDDKKEWVRLVQDIQTSVEEFSLKYHQMLKSGMNQYGFNRLQDCSAVYAKLRDHLIPEAKQMKGEDWISIAEGTAKWMVKQDIWSDFPDGMPIQKALQLGEKATKDCASIFESLRTASEATQVASQQSSR